MHTECESAEVMLLLETVIPLASYIGDKLCYVVLCDSLQCNVHDDQQDSSLAASNRKSRKPLSALFNRKRERHTHDFRRFSISAFESFEAAESNANIQKEAQLKVKQRMRESEQCKLKID